MAIIGALLLLIALNVGASEVNAMSDSVQEVKKKYVQQLMAIEGVRSIGIGRNAQGEVAIIVGLDKPQTELQAQIPPELDGYPVVIQTVGKINAQ